MDTQKNIQESADSASKAIEGRAVRTVSAILRWLEVCLAGLSIIVVIVGICFLVGQLGGLWGNLSEAGLRKTIENVFSDILLIVVGIELAIMLVRRRPEDLVDIIFFVIARKMLIKTDNFYELLIGVAALAGVFAIRKFLMVQPRKKSSAK